MGKDAPAPPDYKGAAVEQAKASKAETEYQTWANRPDIVTPWGTQTWDYSPGGKPASFDQAGYDNAMASWNAMPETSSGYDMGGGDKYGNQAPMPASRGAAPSRDQFTTAATEGPGSWSSKIELSPDQQDALSAQMRIQKGRSGAAEQLLGQASSAFQTPMDWSSLPEQGKVSQDPGEWRQKGQSAIEQLMAPQLARQRSAMETRLANQGITMGSDAWNAAMQSLGDTETRAGLTAIDAGRTEANNMFDTSLRGAQFQNQNRQQSLAEMLQRRSQPLNELNALLTGQQVNSPQMPSFNPAGRAETPNLVGAMQNSYQAELDASNAENAGMAGLMGGLFGLGSAAIGNPAGLSGLFKLSDKRLKKDISHVFTLPNKIKIYKYRFIGSDRMELGVLAQEVQEVMPNAVAVDSNGFLRVNYDMVLA